VIWFGQQELSSVFLNDISPNLTDEIFPSLNLAVSRIKKAPLIKRELKDYR